MFLCKMYTLAAVMLMTVALQGWGIWATHTETNGTLGTLRHFLQMPQSFWWTTSSLLWPFDFAKQTERGEWTPWQDVWLAHCRVCVCGVKVGYSLLLGHVANPLTLAWIPLPDPFSSNKHTLLPDGRGLRDLATGVRVHGQPGEAFT